MKNNRVFFVTNIVFALLFGSCNSPNKTSDKDVLKNDSSPKRISDEVSIVRDPDSRKDYANVFWKRKYTLFDLITDEPIFPEVENGQKIYKIYYSSNEDPNPYQESFTETQLENHLFYKFKNKESCMEFCKSRKKSIHNSV
jgi:hypothetical protein